MTKNPCSAAPLCHGVRPPALRHCGTHMGHGGHFAEGTQSSQAQDLLSSPTPKGKRPKGAGHLGWPLSLRRGVAAGQPSGEPEGLGGRSCIKLSCLRLLAQASVSRATRKSGGQGAPWWRQGQPFSAQRMGIGRWLTRGTRQARARESDSVGALVRIGQHLHLKTLGFKEFLKSLPYFYYAAANSPGGRRRVSLAQEEGAAGRGGVTQDRLTSPWQPEAPTGVLSWGPTQLTSVPTLFLCLSVAAVDGGLCDIPEHGRLPASAL